MTAEPITVISNPDGTPTIRWDMSVDSADQVLAMLGGVVHKFPNSAAIVDPLYSAVSTAFDTTFGTAGTTIGCDGLWPDAAPLTLTEPAVIGDDTGDLLAVLIPGAPDALQAISLAVEVARESGADIDPTDTTLMAEVSRPRWMVLNSCESENHDFHPELALLGSRAPGAVLVTRVDLTHN
jgi:hypothetical protein